jgi:hypothetical protein
MAIRVVRPAAGRPRPPGTEIPGTERHEAGAERQHHQQDPQRVEGRPRAKEAIDDPEARRAAVRDAIGGEAHDQDRGERREHDRQDVRRLGVFRDQGGGFAMEVKLTAQRPTRLHRQEDRAHRDDRDKTEGDSIAAKPFRASHQDERRDQRGRDQDHRHVDEQRVGGQAAVDGGDPDCQRDKPEEAEKREDELRTSPIDSRPPRRSGAIGAHGGDLEDAV